jgi:hypothetical protein
LNQKLTAHVKHFPSAKRRAHRHQGMSRYIFHNNGDTIVPVGFLVELVGLLPSTVEHQLVRYDELSQPGNHAFLPGGEADRD